MELEQLTAFLAVAESGTFSRAAIRLGSTQPVLSRKIKVLEDELGVELFHRTGHGVVLSEGGKLLEKYARGLVETAETARKAVQAVGISPVGQVTIAMPSSIATVLAVDLVREFRRAFPNVFLKVMEGYSGHVLDWLASGRLDVAVLYEAQSLKGSSLQMDPILSDELFLIGPPSDPARVGSSSVRCARLAHIPLALPSRPHGVRLLVDDALAKLGVTPQVQLEIDAMHSMLSLAEHGLAYTILSYSSVRELVLAKRLRVWRIVDPVITRSLVITTASQRPSTKPVRALSRMFREQIEVRIRDGLWAPPHEDPAVASTQLGARLAA